MTVLPSSLRSYATSARQYATSLTWAPLVQLSRTTILAIFSKIAVGQLKIIDADGRVTICGQLGTSVEGPQTELRVHKETFWVRMLLFADMVRCEAPVWCLRFVRSTCR